MHAFLFGDAIAFADKILYCRFVGRDYENIGFPLKRNKNLFSSFLKLLKMIESL